LVDFEELINTPPTSAQAVTSYSYDALDRLVKVTLANGLQLRYGYDAANQRVWSEREAAGQSPVREYHVYGPSWETLADLEKKSDGSFSVKRLYVLTPGKRDRQSAMLVQTAAGVR